jgi:uncharacterized protein with NRDE domain
MCVAAFAWQAHPRWRLVLAGNRDEFHARPTASLARWDDGSGIIAGRDLEAGGTWLGVGRQGRLALVTNVRDLRHDQAGRSRGWLASDWLRGEDDALQASQDLLARAGDYRPFNLLLADGAHCCWSSNRPVPRMAATTPGVHSLSNAELDTPWPKARTLAQRLQDWLQAGEAEDFQPLFAALADATVWPDASLPDTGVGIERERLLSAAFIRGTGYGTRASTVIAIDHEGNGLVIEQSWGPQGVDLGRRRVDLRNND